jgi:hypothetical protein
MFARSSTHSLYSLRLLRLVVLLAIITACLPMRRVSADEVPLVIPKAVVDSTVWKTVWRATYTDARQFEKLLYDAFLLQLYKRNAALDPQQAATQLGELRQKYEAARGANARNPSYEDVVWLMFDVAGALPNFAGLIRAVWTEASSTAGLLPLDPSTSIASGARPMELADDANSREEATLQAVLDAAKQNAAFAQAYDLLSLADMQVSVKDIDAAAMLGKHPTMYITTRIRNNIAPNGTVNISMLELQQLSSSEFAQLDAALTNLRSTLNTINANQESFLDYMKDQQKREAMQKLAKEAADENKEMLEMRNTAFSVIAGFIGHFDPTMGKHTKTILESYGKIGDALDKWLEATAKLSTADAIFSMSTVVMTGNILGAVMNIVSLFGPSKPTPEEQILAEIAKLRQQVADLHKDMSRRFDRIDQQLNVIFTTMNDRFNLIDVKLGKINGNVQEIQRTLVGMSLALSRIERNTYEFLDAAHRRPLLTAINGGIDYQARTGAAMPYQPDFVDHENVFHTWGTVHAFDALSAGPTQRNFGDDQVLAELSALPLDANINYLNGWLVAHGLTPFASNRLANMRDWTFASRAYARLALDWPDHISRINPSRQAALDQVGADLAAAARHISTIDTQSGPQGNKPLFTGVQSYYKSKLTQLDTAIQPIETSFVSDIQTQSLGRAEPFDLWGGMDQPISYTVPELATKMQCGDANSLGLPADNIMKPFVPNLSRYTLAEYMKLGAIKLCLSGEWVNVTIFCNPKLGCQHTGYVKITVDVKYADASGEVSLESRSYTHDYAEDALNQIAQKRAEAWWKDASVRSRFPTQSVRNAPSPELQAQRAAIFNKVTADLQDKLGGFQKVLYARIFQELNAGSLRPLAVELGGGKALLDSFISLGLPNAIANDDLLRSLLFGNQRLFDDGLVMDTYALNATQLVTQVQIITNTRVAIGQLAAERATALEVLLNEYLNAIGTAAHVEDVGLIGDTRMALRMAQRLAKLPGVEGQRKVFIPLVRK